MTEEWSDAAKRCSDVVNLHVVSGNAGRYIAIKLHNGDSDGVLYDDRASAVRHQLHETMCMYFRVPPDGMTSREADALLRWSRFCYDHGYRPTDQDDIEPVMPNSMDEVNRITRSVRIGK